MVTVVWVWGWEVPLRGNLALVWTAGDCCPKEWESDHKTLLTLSIFSSLFLSSLWQTLQEPAGTQLPLCSHSSGQRGGRWSPRPGHSVPAQPQKWEPQTWVPTCNVGESGMEQVAWGTTFFFPLWYLLAVTTDGAWCSAVNWFLNLASHHTYVWAEQSAKCKQVRTHVISLISRWMWGVKGSVLTWPLSHARPVHHVPWLQKSHSQLLEWLIFAG